MARTPREAPEARNRLAEFASDHVRRQAEINDAVERLRLDRDEAVRAAYKEGLPMATIAEVLGLSHQRVSQIVRS